MKKQFFIFLAFIASLVISFTGSSKYAKQGNDALSYSASFARIGNQHHSSISDPTKRLNADRYKVRTKANLDSWEISLPSQWYYRPPVFFSSINEHYAHYHSYFYSAHLLISALRGPPAIAAIPTLV